MLDGLPGGKKTGEVVKQTRILLWKKSRAAGPLLWFPGAATTLPGAMKKNQIDGGWKKMKNEYPVYGRHNDKAWGRDCTGRPYEDLICVVYKREDIVPALDKARAEGWYDLRFKAHEGYSKPDFMGTVIR